eukprot:5925294-Amphidinium_carterae.1
MKLLNLSGDRELFYTQNKLNHPSWRNCVGMQTKAIDWLQSPAPLKAEIVTFGLETLDYNLQRLCRTERGGGAFATVTSEPQSYHPIRNCDCLRTLATLL